MQPLLHFHDSFMTVAGSGGRKPNSHLGANPESAADIELPPVARHDMFDDCKTQACPARVPAAAWVDTVEALGQPGQMFRGNARSAVSDNQVHIAPVLPHAN